MSNSLISKKNNTVKAASAEIFKDMISKVTGVYVALLLAVFPLFVTDMYYNVLNDKYYFFFYSTLITLIIVLMILFIGILGGALRKQKDGTRPLAEMFRLKTEDWVFLAFLFVVVVSTVTSEWLYEAFWGNIGRLQGMFFYLVVGVCWFLVTKFFRYRPFYMILFLTVGAFVCIWGITDYLGMDIFGWRADANDFDAMLAFTSSIGNLNTYSALVSLYFGVSAVMCLGKRKLWFFLPMYFVVVCGLITGSADNAFLAVCGVFGLLPFYVAGDRNRIPGFVLLVAIFLFAMACIGAVTAVWTHGPVLHRVHWGVFLKIGNAWYKKLFAAAAVLALAAAGLTVAGKKTRLFVSDGYSVKKARIVWGVLCVLALLFIGYCIYDSNTACKLAFLEPVRSYLVFDDHWGTRRGYAWRATFEFFGEFNFFKKLFGSGPETYGIFMAKNYYYDMIEFMGTVFDSPHSEPLQYLFTTGILGFVSHYTLMVLAFLRGLKNEGHAAAFGYAVAAYACSSIINISVPITTPLFFLAAALALTVKKNEEASNA